jgi:predicted nuclease with TOPRIM domain
MILVVMVLGGGTWAQEEPEPEQLKKMYEDALAQLKSAQLRKAELAAENEQLTARVAELEKQLGQSQKQVAELQQQSGQWEEKTFLLRAHYAAWRNFVAQHPAIKQRWQVFLESDLLRVGAGWWGAGEWDWPLSTAEKQE